MEPYDPDVVLQPPEDFVCPICLRLAEDAVTPCPEDPHLFCRRCLVSAMAKQEGCPACRRPSTLGTVTPNKFADHLIDNLPARCYLQEAGCPWTGSFNDLRKTHYPSRCKFFPRRDPPPRTDGMAIPLHTRVAVCGLINAPQYNGHRGTIVHYSTDIDRYEVHLEDAKAAKVDTALRLKPLNFIQLVVVTLKGLKAAHLNGATGIVAQWEPQKGRYQVETAFGEVLVRPQNVVVPSGTICWLEGLTGAPQYNRTWGKVLDVDHEAQRYTLELAGEVLVKPRWANIRV